MLFKKAKPLKDPSDVEHAYAYALFLLNLRMRTEQEMREKMQNRGYIASVINTVIERLYEDRYLNDDHFAEMMIENMKSYKYYGLYSMKKKLMEKKLPKELIAEKLESMLTVEEEKKIAAAYVKKEYGDLKEVRKLPYEERQKILRRLLGRGFRIDALPLK